MTHLEKLAAVMALLRRSEELEKVGGLFSSIGKIYGAVAKGAQTTGKELNAMNHPILGGIASLAPAAGVAYLGHKLYQSQPVQQALYNYRMRKAQKQMKKEAAGWLSNLGRGIAAGFTGGELTHGAGGVGRMLGQVGQGLAVSGLVAGLGLAGGKGIGMIRDRFTKAKNMQAMIEANPALQKEDAGHVKMLFDTLHRLSPTMAKDPILSGSFVRDSLRLGPEGQPSVRFDTARMLADTERMVQSGGKGHPVLQAMMANMRPMGYPPQRTEQLGSVSLSQDPHTGLAREQLSRSITDPEQLMEVEQRLRQQGATAPRMLSPGEMQGRGGR